MKDFLYMKRVRIKCEQLSFGSVLIVDNIETNILIAKELLSPYDMTISSALSGGEAIRKVRSGNVYDVILMDHIMPELSGIDTTKHLRGMGYENPIVAMTESTISGQAGLFLRSGFDDFISKPLQIRCLNFIVNRFIRDKQPPEVFEEARKHTSGRRHDLLTKSNRLLFENEVAGLDIAKGLKKHNDDMVVYTSVLRTYSKDIRALLRTIEYIDKNWLSSYKITVQSIKDASFEVYANRIGETAEILEKAAAIGELDYIERYNPSFLQTSRKLLDRLDSMLTNIDTKIQTL